MVGGKFQDGPLKLFIRFYLAGNQGMGTCHYPFSTLLSRYHYKTYTSNLSQDISMSEPINRNVTACEKQSLHSNRHCTIRPVYLKTWNCPAKHGTAVRAPHFATGTRGPFYYKKQKPRLVSNLHATQRKPLKGHSL